MSDYSIMILMIAAGIAFIVPDMLFCLALGASCLYKQPEERMTYSAYIRAIIRFSMPFLLIRRGGFGRYAVRARYTRQYAMYMFLSLCLTASTFYVFGTDTLRYAAAFSVGHLLLAMVYVDVRTQYLPDFFMLPALGLSFVIAICGLFLPWQHAIAGGAIGFGMMWGINALFKLIRRKDGMGFGDFILTGLLGLWVGPLLLPHILFLSSVIGLTGAVVYGLLTKGNVQQQFAFGPALACAGWGMFFYVTLYGHPLLTH